MPVLNYLPFLYALAGSGFVLWQHQTWPQTLLIALGWLYLIPPLFGRLILWRHGAPSGIHAPEDPDFFRWWLLTQLQLIYGRFPVTEELLRLVPGLYSFWLRLWGSPVSLFVYWAPGVVVTDRYHLRIGPRVIVAPGVRIGGHVLQTRRDGTLLLTVAPVRIDAGAMIGLMAALGPGCHVHAHETLPPRKLLRPFMTWKDGTAHAQSDAERG